MPREIKEGITYLKCVLISAGDSFSAALTEEGRVFMWGDNCYGQLGLYDKLEDENYLNIALPVELNFGV